MFNRVRVVNMLSWCLLFVFIPLSANADTAAKSPSCIGTIFELLLPFILKPILSILWAILSILWAIFSTLAPFIIPVIIVLIIIIIIVKILKKLIE